MPEQAPLADPLRFGTGHAGSVLALLSFAGRTGNDVLASAGDDGAIRIWDPVTATAVVPPLRGHADWVRALSSCTTRDGRQLVVSGADDATILRWDLESGAPVGEPLLGHRSGVQALHTVTLPRGGVILVSGGGDGTVLRWDIEAGTLLGDPLDVTSPGVCLSSFRDATGRSLLVTAGVDGVIHRWDATTGERVGGEFGEGDGPGIRSCHTYVSEDGQILLACGYDDGVVRRWELGSMRQAGRPFLGHEGPVSAVGSYVRDDGSVWLVSGGDDGTVRQWQEDTGEAGETLHTRSGPVVAMAPLIGGGDQGLIATASTDGAIRFWDRASGVPYGHSLFGHVGSVVAVAGFQRAGGGWMLATGGADGTIRRWNAGTGDMAGRQIHAAGGPAWSLVSFVQTDGRPILAVGDATGVIRSWDALTGQSMAKGMAGGTGQVWCLAPFVGREGRPLLAAGSADGSISVWDPHFGLRVQGPLSGHRGSVIRLVPFDDASGRSLMASGGADGTVRFWDLESGEECRAPADEHDGPVWALTSFLHPDGRTMIVSGGADGTVRCWDPASATSDGAVLIGHAGAVWSLTSFTDEGHPYLASGGTDGTILRWDPVSGRRAFGRALRGHSGVVQTLTVLSPLNRPMLVSGGQDGEIIVRPATVTAPPRPTSELLARVDEESTHDVLGRDLLARHLLDLIGRVATPERPVVVHIDGRWGAGKTTLLNLFVNRSREAGIGFRDPLVVRYDAWRESAVAPEWWSLGRALHDEIQRSRLVWVRWMMTLMGVLDRVRRSRPVLTTGIVLAFFVVAVALTRGQGSVPAWVEALTQVLAAAVAVGGVVLVAGKALFWAAPAFGSLHARADDNPLGGVASTVAGLRRWTPRGRGQRPVDLLALVVVLGCSLAVPGAVMQRTVAAVAGVVVAAPAAILWAWRTRSLLSVPRRPIVLAIDDVDRCRADRVVALIETVHTLLREPARTRLFPRWRTPAELVVLALVEGRWVRCSFEAQFAEFQGLRSPVHGLGADFLHKVFDHTVLVPALSSQQTQRFVDHLAETPIETLRWRRSAPERLAGVSTEGPPSGPGAAVTPNPAAGDGESGPTRPDGAHDARADAPSGGGVLPAPDATRLTAIGAVAAAAASQADMEDLTEHLLTTYANLLPPNPRLIKRVVNTWTMLAALQQHLDNAPDEDTLVRAAVVYVRFPVLVDDLLTRERPPDLDRPGEDEPVEAWHLDEVLDVLIRPDGTAVGLADLARCYGRTFSARSLARAAQEDHVIDLSTHDDGVPARPG